MLEELMREVWGMWNWVLGQLGWTGELGWFKIAVLVLAFFGAIFLLRRLFGGSSVGGGGGSTVIYPSERQRGFPTSFYVGNRRLGDFDVPREVYDFKVRGSTPDLSGLRKPVTLDWETARKLFIPQTPGKPERSQEAASSRRDGSKEWAGTRRDSGETGVRRPDVKLDWDLAEKLFIPHHSGKTGRLRRR